MGELKTKVNKASATAFIKAVLEELISRSVADMKKEYGEK